MRLIQSLFLLMLPALTSVTLAAEPVSLHLRQAVATLPQITVYLDTRDTAGQPATGLEPARFSATVGAQTAQIESVQPLAESGEGVAYIFLVDISKSLKSAQFARIKQAMEQWIGTLTPKDRAAILTFGETVQTLQGFTADTALLRKQVAQLAPTDMRTNLYGGLVQALDLARRTIPGLPGQRVIVTLTDGVDDAMGGVTEQEVLDRLREDRVPIYAVGFAAPPKTPAKDAALKSLGRLARLSGGEYLDGGNRPGEAYLAARQRIRDGWVVRLRCPDCTADGRVQRVQLSLRLPSRLLSDGLDVRLLPPLPEAPPAPTTSPAATDSPDSTEADPLPESADATGPPGPSGEPAEFGDRGLLAQWPSWSVGIAGLVGLLIVAGGVWGVARHRRARSAAAALETAPDSVPAAATSVPPAPPGTHETARPASPGLRLTLAAVSRRGPSRNYSLELHDRAVVGRGARECDLVIDGDPEISTMHCLLLRDDQRVQVRDLNSTNGVLVNGVLINGDYTLGEGDVLLLGKTELRVAGIAHRNQSQV